MNIEHTVLSYIVVNVVGAVIVSAAFYVVMTSILHVAATL